MNTEIMPLNNEIEIAKQAFPKKLKNCNEANFEKLIKKIPITKFYERINDNKESALSLVPLKFDDIKEVHFNNPTIIMTILDFFDTYHEITRNKNSNNKLTNFLKKHKNIINKKQYLFKQCLTLLAYNGHKDSVEYVYSLFENKFDKFKKINTTLTEKISNETEHLNNLSRRINPVKVGRDKKLGPERYQRQKKAADKYNKKQEKKNKPIMDRIAKNKTTKKNKLSDFISSIKPIIHFYSLFIQNSLLDDNFDVNILDNNFLEICRILHNLSETENLQNIADNSIQEELNSIIPELITAFLNAEQKNKNSQRAYTPGHLIKLDQLYQNLFKYTSDIETKRRLLNAYKNENYPIAHYIIKDALNNEINLQDENKEFIIDYIEHKYTQIQNEDNKNDLKNYNSKFIKNPDFPENIRKKAFDWYLIIDNDEKTDFYWEIIEFIDKQNNLDSCYSEIYKKCEEYLIINETEDKILEKLQIFMNSDESKGHIISLINGAFHNINDTVFGSKATEYKQKLKINKPFDTFDKNPWEERKKIKCETKLIEN